MWCEIWYLIIQQKTWILIKFWSEFFQAASESINGERLARLEQRVAALWESIQQGELKAKQQHEEAVGLVQTLQDQINTQTDRESLSLWVSQLLEPKFTALKGDMERVAVSRAEVRMSAHLMLYPLGFVFSFCWFWSLVIFTFKVIAKKYIFYGTVLLLMILFNNFF